jgi:hypothetical protein
LDKYKNTKSRFIKNSLLFKLFAEFEKDSQYRLMQYKSLKYLILFILVLFSGCSMFGIRSGYEQLSYNIIENFNDIEIRNYPKRVAIEIQDAENDREAFFALFDYISGKNINNANISMTSPVEVSRENLKITMTSPVEKKNINNKVQMRFFLPKELTIENSPKPINPKVKVIEIPEQTFAVLNYSGFNGNEKFNAKAEELKLILSKSLYKIVGEPTYFGYDPPFTIPFLRKHEVLIPVEK